MYTWQIYVTLIHTFTFPMTFTFPTMIHALIVDMAMTQKKFLLVQYF